MVSSLVSSLVSYFVALTPGKTILWCYFLWYLTTVLNYFDPSPSLWLNSLGISGIIGFALLLSINLNAQANPDRWQIFRLFLMPFCVSSFSSLIKEHNFILILPSDPNQSLVCVGTCLAFVLLIWTLKRSSKQAET